jgi:hypothetical protein
MTRSNKDHAKTKAAREQTLALFSRRKTVQGDVTADDSIGVGNRYRRGAWNRKSERSDGQRGYRSGHYRRKLTTRLGTLELRVPQDRDGRFANAGFARCQRSEKAVLLAQAAMQVHGVCTRMVMAVTEELELR